MSRLPALALLLVLALLAGGCGLGQGEETGEATLKVTRDFGAEPVGQSISAEVTGGETVMRLLQRRFDVETRYGGTFVQAIDGIAGGRESGRVVDWFYYVNGIEAEVGAAEKRLAPGDRVWWDHHDWSTTMRIPAVVGSFPEPFISGQDGKRFPVRLDCARDVRRACDEVEQRLELVGVEGLGRTTIGQTQGAETLRVVVGRWRDVRLDLAARQIERGPRASGVYARFAPSGRELDILDERGRVVRTLGAGSALVAATRGGEEPPTWVVTGTDDVGVAAAAAALRTELLTNRFAVAIEAGRAIPLPVAAP